MIKIRTRNQREGKCQNFENHIAYRIQRLKVQILTWLESGRRLITVVTSRHFRHWLSNQCTRFTNYW